MSEKEAKGPATQNYSDLSAVSKTTREESQETSMPSVKPGKGTSAASATGPATSNYFDLSAAGKDKSKEEKKKKEEVSRDGAMPSVKSAKKVSRLDGETSAAAAASTSSPKPKGPQTQNYYDSSQAQKPSTASNDQSLSTDSAMPVVKEAKSKGKLVSNQDDTDSPKSKPAKAATSPKPTSEYNAMPPTSRPAGSYQDIPTGAKKTGGSYDDLPSGGLPTGSLANAAASLLDDGKKKKK